MYKVLIIDDEPLIRQGLHFLVNWNSLGFEIVGDFENGEKALEWISHNSVDLLVTDVKMPKMNGIELVQKLRQSNSNLRVIVVSGYDEFEYVRAMAPLGIENYLLKPINEDEFSETLCNIARKLDHELATKAKVELDENIIRHNIVNRWLYGAIGENELQERAAFLGIDLEAASFCPVHFRFHQEAEHVSAQLCNDIFKICKEILQAGSVSYCTQNYDGETLVVVCGWDEKQMLPLLSKCVNEVRQNYGLTLLVCAGETVSGYWQLTNSFRALRKKSVFINLKSYIDVGEEDFSLEEKSPFSIRLAQYVLENYGEDLSLKLLAHHFKGNAAYIGQIFRRDMGQTFGEYLKAVRLEKAQLLLRTSDIAAGEIAQQVGFRNHNYFFTIFRKEFGISPNEYRRNHSEATGM